MKTRGLHISQRSTERSDFVVVWIILTDIDSMDPSEPASRPHAGIEHKYCLNGRDPINQIIEGPWGLLGSHPLVPPAHLRAARGDFLR